MATLGALFGTGPHPSWRRGAWLARTPCTLALQRVVETRDIKPGRVLLTTLHYFVWPKNRAQSLVVDACEAIRDPLDLPRSWPNPRPYERGVAGRFLVDHPARTHHFSPMFSGYIHITVCTGSMYWLIAKQDP
jgi:hypothetical protein